MDPALRSAVDDAYRAFRRFGAPAFPLDVCLACCVSVEVEQQLRERPLQQLTTRQLHDYNDSAKQRIQNPREVGYFVPRMLELLAEGAEIHHSMEISLDRVGRCPADSWSGEQRAVLDRFAQAYFAAVLRDGARRWPDDPLSILLMFDIGGLAIAPLLARWQACEDPQAILRFVESTYWQFWPDENYTNGFASDRPVFRERLREWMLDPACRRVFADRLLSPEFQRLAASHESGTRTPFPLMVDAVFDHLTR